MAKQWGNYGQLWQYPMAMTAKSRSLIQMLSGILESVASARDTTSPHRAGGSTIPPHRQAGA
jgi:hypothetical protein